MYVEEHNACVRVYMCVCGIMLCEGMYICVWRTYGVQLELQVVGAS